MAFFEFFHIGTDVQGATIALAATAYAVMADHGITLFLCLFAIASLRKTQRCADEVESTRLSSGLTAISYIISSTLYYTVSASISLADWVASVYLTYSTFDALMIIAIIAVHTARNIRLSLMSQALCIFMGTTSALNILFSIVSWGYYSDFIEVEIYHSIGAVYTALTLTAYAFIITIIITPYARRKKLLHARDPYG